MIHSARTPTGDLLERRQLLQIVRAETAHNEHPIDVPAAVLSHRVHVLTGDVYEKTSSTSERI